MKPALAFALACSAALAGCAGTADSLHSPPLTAEVPQGRLLYAAKEAGEAQAYRIEILDIGSSAPRVLVRSGEPLASPRWSPDGRNFAYVSLEHGRAALVLQSLASGLPRTLVTDADAIGPPAWSPDGKNLAFSMQREGNTDIYVLDLSSQVASRLTQEPGSETEPSYAPDGRSLALTSDRSGSPQIYDLTLRRAKLQLLVPEVLAARQGRYSPDGHSVVFVLRGEAGESIELLNLDSGERVALSQGPADESPVFSPDGHFVAYTAHAEGHAIELVSSDGRVRQSLRTAAEVREPSWAPPIQ
jgi:TolB protein